MRWARRFILFHGKRHPKDMGATEVVAFLTWLATERAVAAPTQTKKNRGLVKGLMLRRMHAKVYDGVCMDRCVCVLHGILRVDAHGLGMVVTAGGGAWVLWVVVHGFLGSWGAQRLTK